MVEKTIEDWEEFYREASAKTDLLAKKYPKIPQTTLDEMEAVDPARGKSVEWMARQLNSEEIRWPEDQNRLKKALESFWQIKKSPRTLAQYSANPDLSTYSMGSLKELDDKVRGIVERPEALTSEIKGTQKIYDDGIYSILKPDTPEVACDLAKGTKWCTSDVKNAKSYMGSEGLSVWFKNGKKFAQSSGNQFMDLRNEEIEPSPEMGKIYWKLFKKLPHKLSERIPEIEGEIAQDMLASLYYARAVLKGRFPEAEPKILENPGAILVYVKEVIKERWSEGERVLKDDPFVAIDYARLIIGGRFPEAEPNIVNSEWAYRYADKIIKGRWPEAEPEILKDPKESLAYVRNVVRGRWPEAEEIIFSNDVVGKNYVKYLAEKGISDPREQEAVNKEFSPNV